MIQLTPSALSTPSGAKHVKTVVSTLLMLPWSFATKEAEAWSKALLIDPAALAALPSGTELGGLLLEVRLALEDERFAALCDWRSAAR